MPSAKEDQVCNKVISPGSQACSTVPIMNRRPVLVREATSCWA